MTQPIDPRIEQILSQVEVYQQVAAGDYGVPAWQALPIASNPDIAFRPHCQQLEPVWQATDTAWVWQGQTIYTTLGQGTMGQQTALELQAAGVCITGSHAVDVPLVSTDEVYAKFTNARSNAVALISDSATTEPAPTATAEAPIEASAGGVSLWLLGVAVVLAGLGVGAQFLLRSKNVKATKKGKSAATTAPAENDGMEDTVQLDYDFEL